MLLLLVLACAVDPTPKPDEPVVWSDDLAPVLAERCVGCHASALAPYPLATWEDVSAVSTAIVAAVEAGRMPPWPFQEDACRSVPGSLGLTEEERALFLAWRDGGYLRGDGEPDTSPPLDPAPPRAADVTVSPPEPFEVTPVETDPYWCGYVSEPLPEERWVEGAEILVDTVSISHHGFVYAVPPTAQAAVDARDAGDPLPGFRCDGGLAMADGITLLAGWAPGSPAWWPGDGAYAAGVRVPAGSRLAVEMHYNTTALDMPATDSPAWKLWFAEERPPWTLITLPLADLDLAIPSGAVGWEESSTTRLPVDALLVSTAPHMHGLGRAVTTTLTRADGEEVCLTALEGWDFDWQFSYPAAGEGIPVNVTDTIQLTCTFDNPGDAEVQWGERTDEEMCLDYLAFVVPSDPDGVEGVCGDFAPCFSRCDTEDPLCALTCLAHSGEACLTCGSDAMFGDCTVGACLSEAMDLDACTRRCPDLESDYAGCISTTCAEAWGTYASCWRETFEAGICEEDHATCTGMTPGG